MASNPQIHYRHTLPSLVNPRLPLPINHSPDPPLRLLPGQHLLRLVRTKHARPHGRRHQRLEVAHHVHVRRLVERQPYNRANCTKQRCQVCRDGRRFTIRRAVLEQGREFAEDRQVGALGERGSKRALPYGQEGPALRDAGSPADGADDRCVELVVQFDERARVAVGGEDKGQRCGGVGGE